MEEKQYQDNGELDRKPYNFFKQEPKRKIRIGEKEHVRSELMNTNGNGASIWKIINQYVREKKNCQFVKTTTGQLFQACYRVLKIVNSN